MTIPAPGGAVGAKTMVVYSLGAALGIFAAANYLVPALPEQAVNWSVGPLNGTNAWFGVGAILGAAFAAKLADGLK